VYKYRGEEDDDQAALRKRLGERNVDSGLQVQLEDDEDGSTRQSG